MLKRIIFTVFLLLLMSYQAHAQGARTLEQHIGQICKGHKTCIDAQTLVGIVDNSARKYKIDPVLLYSLAHIESNFNPNAKNSENGLSAGLFQIQVRWHKKSWPGISDWFDPQTNTDVAASILQYCQRKESKRKTKRKPADLRHRTLMCYNGYHTETYPARVLRAYKTISKLNGISLVNS